MDPHETQEVETIQVVETSLRLGLNRLRFEQPLEDLYQRDHALGSVRHVRSAAIFGLIIYALFGMMDYWIIERDFSQVALIRYALVCPIIMLSIYIMKFPSCHRHVFTLANIIMFTVAITLMVIVVTGGQYMSILGLLPLIMFLFTGLRMGFRESTLCAWVIFAAFLFVGLQLQNSEGLPTDFFRFGFLMVLINFLGMFSSYTLERHRRKDYLQTHLLEFEAQQLEALGERLLHLSTTDELTQLSNRRYFQERFEEEWRRAIREKRPLSLILLDVDDFKAFNDNYGHQPGDDCLMQVGHLLRQKAQRSGEVAARYGGEEFVLLFPGSSPDKAAALAETIREGIVGLNITHTFSRTQDVVTVSAGVAGCIPTQDMDPSDLLSQADQSLYKAKNRGRNQVVTYVEPPAAA